MRSVRKSFILFIHNLHEHRQSIFPFLYKTYTITFTFLLCDFDKSCLCTWTRQDLSSVISVLREYSIGEN